MEHQTTVLLRDLYLFVKDMDDRQAGDFSGRVDTWQSDEFVQLLNRVKEHLSL